MTGTAFQMLPLLLIFYCVDDKKITVSILSTHGLFINTPSNTRFHLHISPTSHFTTNKYTIRNEEINAKRLLLGGNTTTIPSSVPSALHCIVSVTRVILLPLHAIHHPIHSIFCDKVNGCYSILNNTLHILFTSFMFDGCSMMEWSEYHIPTSQNTQRVNGDPQLSLSIRILLLHPIEMEFIPLSS